MGTVYVKTPAEMNVQNRLFYKKVRDAQINTINYLGKVNEKASKKLVNPLYGKGGMRKYPMGGALFASIHIENPDVSKVQVLASDYGTSGIAEIEEGLQGTIKERETKNDPKLSSWAKTILGFVPKTIKVGQSEGDIPHPSGLHYMKFGFNAAKSEVNNKLRLELSKV